MTDRKKPDDLDLADEPKPAVEDPAPEAPSQEALTVDNWASAAVEVFGVRPETLTASLHEYDPKRDAFTKAEVEEAIAAWATKPAYNGEEG